MASIVQGKKDVFGSLSALKVVTGAQMPELPDFNSFGSINNEKDSPKFLIDLLKALNGANAVLKVVKDTITYKLPDIEIAIKDGLKDQLKEMVSCSVNPEIPEWFQNGGTGVEMKVTDIDFYSMMHVDPDSVEGRLIYSDIPSGENSKDFNTYLYYSIQDENNPKLWGSSVTGTNMLETTFTPTGATNNNILKFTTSTEYSDKKLPEFNNDYIDSLTLFGEPNSLDSATFIALLLEELFGSISFATRKSKRQIKKELEMKTCLDCIINSEDDVITDNFFTFDNATLAKIGADVNNRALGIRQLETCGELAIQMDGNVVADAQETLNNTGSTPDDAVSDALDDIADKQAEFANSPFDIPTIKGNFFEETLLKLVRIFMGIIISPKFIALFAINHQIIYGQGTGYVDAVDFIKKNSKLMKHISKIIRNIILNIMLKEVLKLLGKLLKKKFGEDQKEKGVLYLVSILSVLGIPPSIIAQINNI